jgi:hypothetical protein
MSVNFTLLYCKTKLQEIDYRERLSKIFDWVEKKYIDKDQFIELINYSVDLDLVPTED